MLGVGVNVNVPSAVAAKKGHSSNKGELPVIEDKLTVLAGNFDHENLNNASIFFICVIM